MVDMFGALNIRSPSRNRSTYTIATTNNKLRPSQFVRVNRLNEFKNKLI